MTLHPHWGHEPLIRTLSRARNQDSLPGALLIQGPKGVGKQHLALWLGRLLLCASPGPEGPCDECTHCRLALRIEHPDLHWFFPLPRPKKASTPEKLASALEEARWRRLAEIRQDPLQPVSQDGPRSLYLAAARTLRKQAQQKPSMGSRQVFILAEAEALSPKDSSSEAANALLKLLEEPPPGTFLILTSGEPGRLLPTILSRTTHLRLPPLKRDEVINFLREVARVEPDEAQRAGALSHGSIGRALRLLDHGEEKSDLEKVRRDAFGLLSAALDPTSTPSFQSALARNPTGARGLMELLDFLEEWLRDLAMAAAGDPVDALNPGAEKYFRDLQARVAISPPSVAEAMTRVEGARAEAAGNANPQLLVFSLLQDLRRTLVDPNAVPTAGS